MATKWFCNIPTYNVFGSRPHTVLRHYLLLRSIELLVSMRLGAVLERMRDWRLPHGRANSSTTVPPLQQLFLEHTSTKPVHRRSNRMPTTCGKLVLVSFSHMVTNPPPAPAPPTRHVCVRGSASTPDKLLCIPLAGICPEMPTYSVYLPRERSKNIPFNDFPVALRLR